MKHLYRHWRNAEHPAPPRALLTQFCRRAAELAGLPTDWDWDLAIDFVNDRVMTRANREIVGHIGTTDVITLSYFDTPDGLFPGDVAVELIVNPDAATREGAKLGTGYAYEMALYVAHGLLHSAGEDDLTPKKRKHMRSREQEVLSGLAENFDFSAVFPE